MPVWPKSKTALYVAENCDTLSRSSVAFIKSLRFRTKPSCRGDPSGFRLVAIAFSLRLFSSLFFSYSIEGTAQFASLSCLEIFTFSLFIALMVFFLETKLSEDGPARSRIVLRLPRCFLKILNSFPYIF